MSDAAEEPYNPLSPHYAPQFVKKEEEPVKKNDDNYSDDDY